MASSKKASKIKSFLGAIGVIKEDKHNVRRVNLSERYEQSAPELRKQAQTEVRRKTSIPEEFQKRANSVSETVQGALNKARSTISEPVKGKWTELRRKYSTDIKLEDITKYISDNPEQARSFLKNRSTGVFSKRNYHQEYLNNPNELFKLYSENPEISEVIQDLYPQLYQQWLISGLQLKHHERYQRSSITESHQKSIYEEGIADLESLQKELAENKPEQDQLPLTPKSPLDELLDEIKDGTHLMTRGAKDTPANFQQVSKEKLDEILAPLEGEEEKDLPPDTNNQEAMDDLDNLLGGLTDAKAKREQTLKKVEGQLDEIGNLLDVLESQGFMEERKGLQAANDVLDELNLIISKGIETKISNSLNNIVTSMPINGLEENPQQVNEIVQKIQKDDIKLDDGINKNFKDAKDLLSTKHTAVIKSKNLEAMEDLQARYALFNQWVEGLASIPGYESLGEYRVNQETLNELQKAIEIAKLPPKEEEKDLDQWLKELVGAKPQNPMDSNEQKDVLYQSGIGALDDLLGDLKSDKETDVLVERGHALVSKWESLDRDNASEKEKRNFVREYEVYLRELDAAGKDALKSTIAVHANKMAEIRASMPAQKINLRYEGELSTSQGNVSDLAVKKAQEVLARQTHKTACLEVLENLEDVAYKNLLSDAISNSQRKGKLALPAIDTLRDFVEKANIALNSKEGLDAARHHALLSDSNEEAIIKLFSQISMKTTYTSSAQAVKNAKPYEVRSMQPSATAASLLPITTAELQAGMSRLKKVSDKPQSLSERIDKRKSDATLNNNTTLKK